MKTENSNTSEITSAEESVLMNLQIKSTFWSIAGSS